MVQSQRLTASDLRQRLSKDSCATTPAVGRDWSDVAVHGSPCERGLHGRGMEDATIGKCRGKEALAWRVGGGRGPMTAAAQRWRHAIRPSGGVLSRPCRLLPEAVQQRHGIIGGLLTTMPSAFVRRAEGAATAVCHLLLLPLSQRPCRQRIAVARLEAARLACLLTRRWAWVGPFSLRPEGQNYLVQYLLPVRLQRPLGELVTK